MSDNTTRDIIFACNAHSMKTGYKPSLIVIGEFTSKQLVSETFLIHGFDVEITKDSEFNGVRLLVSNREHEISVF